MMCTQGYLYLIVFMSLAFSSTTLLTWLYLRLNNRTLHQCPFTSGTPSVSRMPPTSSKPIFVFDLHGVVFTLNVTKLVRIGLTNISWELILLIINPFFWRECIKIAYKSNVVEEFFDTLATSYPLLQKYRYCAIAMTNAQDPIWKTIACIKKLRQEGYPCALFSNIGRDTLDHLTQRYPDILHLFEQKIFAQASDGWVQKPAEESFQKLINTLNISPEAIIFIDNKRKNCIAATKHRINAIHFSAFSSLHKKLYRAIKIARAGAAHTP